MERNDVEYEFEDLVLDTRQHGVFRGATRIQLSKLNYEMLLALVKAAPAALSHEALLEQVWPGRVVAVETIAQRIRLVRQALDDDAVRPRYIQGIRGFGYQLVPPVRIKATPLPTAIEEQAPIKDALELPAQPSIAVLPFSGQWRAADDRDLAFGLSQDILTQIARTRTFFVIARGTAMRFADPTLDPVDISRELGVRYILQGSLEQRDRRLSLQVTLTDGVAGQVVWADHLHRKIDDLFELQEQVVDDIVGTVETEVSLAEQRRALLQPSADLDAWSAYHRGCWHMYHFDPASNKRAEHFFELSSKLDPSGSRAFSGLSFVHWNRAFLEYEEDRDAAVGRAFVFANRSVQLDPRDPLARWALGRAHLLSRDVSASIRELDMASELNPSFAVGRYSLGFALVQDGETQRSADEAAAALRLSPYDPMRWAMLGLHGFSETLAGNYERGADLLAEAVNQPHAHYQLLAKAIVSSALAGRDSDARRFLDRVHAERPDYGCDDFLRAFAYSQDEHVAMIREAFGSIGH
ncbi:MAG: winged helix-turn-helix domain-containing protein [Pseudomonadota bacterium]